MRRSLASLVQGQSTILGASGRRYLFDSLIQEREHVGRVWRARCENTNYVLKEVPTAYYNNFDAYIWPRLREKPSKFIRLPANTAPDQRIFVYEYLDDDFLDLARQRISYQSRRHILKKTLQGIADLHTRDIVHLDVKPDNVMVSGGTSLPNDISRVHVIDLENAAYLPEGTCIKGRLMGNENWRSPEALLMGKLTRASDIFSYGLVCIYGMLGRVVCGRDVDFAQVLEKGVYPVLIRLQRLISYFGDHENVVGLQDFIGDNALDRKMIELS